MVSAAVNLSHHGGFKRFQKSEGGGAKTRRDIEGAELKPTGSPEAGPAELKQNKPSKAPALDELTSPQRRAVCVGASPELAPRGTMRLRSQKTVNVTSGAETPRTNRRPSTRDTPREATVTQEKEPVDSDSHLSDDEIPIMTRRPMPRGRARKRAVAVEDRATDASFKTPIRSSAQRERVLSEIDPVSPRNATDRNIYSPIVRFLTPTKENVKRAGNTVLMSPEQGMFGFGSIDLLAGEEEDDIFNPFTFIKNLPSQHSQPQLLDIPPKTRSTPEATLVVDLEETLMFSSLNVIEDADYTFTAAFQDHQYKEDFREVLKKRKDHFHRLLSED
ncbi:CTD small phosphatase-like protein 2 [Liparis tanakae]|uniref:CTD small phosphatase-like protein 2 n=1 Tax=Liparis tanakae TaxID=230148 RepID=A0A4Z2F9S3_9TELE|nr:CTD small phosphatase-like protein 2 [Liparis tanakae]